jgi:aminoglycoside phosphotransferase (APT) family kinase protein
VHGGVPALSLTEDPGITRAVRRRFGETAVIENLVQPTLGGSNRTVLFDLVHEGTRRRLVSRQETFVSPDSPFVPPTLQFRAMRMAHEHGIEVPEPVFEYDEQDAMGAGFVTAFVAGETMPRALLQGADFAAIRPHLVPQLAAALARLHALPLAPFAFLEKFPASTDPLDALRAQLDLYREPHPAIELGLRWLERNRPQAARRVVVHGDFRVGNFMVGAGGLAALLDWECCHLGAAAEDLGWFCTRAWRFGQNHLPAGGLATRETLLAAYAAAGGDAIPLDELRYWEIFGLTRWAILNVMQAFAHVFEGRQAVTWAACGRNTALIEYDLLLTLQGRIA